jgi:hypothetical protein
MQKEVETKTLKPTQTSEFAMEIHLATSVLITFYN